MFPRFFPEKRRMDGHPKKAPREENHRESHKNHNMIQGMTGVFMFHPGQIQYNKESFRWRAANATPGGERFKRI